MFNTALPMEPNTENRRNQFLAVALREFVARGYHGTSTRSISTAAETSPGLLFHYFRSKEALYDELVELGCRHLAFDLDAALKNPLEFFRRSAEDSLTMVRENPETSLMFTFMTSAQRAIGTTEKSAELLRSHDIVPRSVPVIKAGQQAHTIRDGDPLSLSVTFWGAVGGIVEEVGLQPQAEPRIDWVLDILREGDAR